MNEFSVSVNVTLAEFYMKAQSLRPSRRSVFGNVQMSSFEVSTGARLRHLMKAEIKLVKLGENVNGEGLIVCNEEVIFSLSVSSEVHRRKLWRACE